MEYYYISSIILTVGMLILQYMYARTNEIMRKELEVISEMVRLQTLLIKLYIPEHIKNNLNKEDPIDLELVKPNLKRKH